MGRQIVLLPDGRLAIVSDEFEHAANATYKAVQARFFHGSKALWDEVIGQKGEVDFYTACQFLESHARGNFKYNKEISDIRTRQPLKALGFETVINLYEAVVERPMEDNSLYLDLLNKSIDITAAELKEWTEPIKRFYSEKNVPFIEKKWEEAKHDGRIATAEGSFSETIAHELNSPELISKGEYMRRKALLQFISDTYSEFAGEEKVQIELISGPDALGGFHTKDEETGQQVIGINVNNFAFQSNFMSILNVLSHERYHASDQMLGDAYRAGQIPESESCAKRARIAAAAMGKNGYISGDYQAGPLAYRDQIIEVGAHYAGRVGEYHAHETYAKPPEPIISLRKDEDRKELAQAYEALAMRRSRFAYPEGMSPYGGRQPVPNFG